MAAGLKDMCVDMVRMGGFGKPSAQPLPESKPQWRCQWLSATIRRGEKRRLLDAGDEPRVGHARCSTWQADVGMLREGELTC